MPHPLVHSNKLALATAALLLRVAVGCAPSTPPVPPASLGTGHPLVGKIWSPTKGAYLSEDELQGALAEVRIVLLGEQHDNPDHHRLQARTLRRMGELGRRPVVVFEMIDRDRQPQVDECLDRRRCTAADLAAAAAWDERGWPDWKIYGPVLDYVVREELLVVAGGLERDLVRSVARTGKETLDPELRERLGLDARIPRRTRKAMIEEIRISHCGHPPEHLIEGMVDAQRLRDAFMASQLASAQVSTTAVLIAGHGHVRTDWAVPTHLEKMAPAAEVFAIAFVEVRDELLEPADYAELFGAPALPFDAVWFTARVDDEDPCELFREQLEKMKTP